MYTDNNYILFFTKFNFYNNYTIAVRTFAIVDAQINRVFLQNHIVYSRWAILIDPPKYLCR